jgi:hypothetical protein
MEHALCCPFYATQAHGPEFEVIVFLWKIKIIRIVSLSYKCKLQKVSAHITVAVKRKRGRK